MSIVLTDGTVLPDIPADVLAEHPNAVITVARSTTDDITVYSYMAAANSFGYIDLGEEGESYGLGTGRFVMTPSDPVNSYVPHARGEIEVGNTITEWGEPDFIGGYWSDFFLPIGEEVESNYEDIFFATEVVWANHDVFECVGSEDGNGFVITDTVYFPNSLAKPPFILPDGTELPALPEGCFEKHPYGIVGQNTGQYYALVVSRTPGIYHEAGEQFSVPTLVFEKNPGYVVYLYKPENDTGWWVYTDSSGDGEGNNFAAGSMATTDWCNYDVVYENGALYRKSDVNYRIYGGWLNSMGNQARRLGNVSGALKPGEMETVFKGVTAGGSGQNVQFAETILTDEMYNEYKSDTVLDGGSTLVLSPYSQCVETAEGTSLTGTIGVFSGYWALATVTTRSDTTFPDDWELLHESVVLTNGINQRMAFLCKEADADGTVSLNIIQSEAQRIYINLIAFPNCAGIAYHEGTEVYSNAEVANDAITVSRPNCKCVVWGCSANLWTTSTPYGSWVCDDVLPICLDQTSTQPRQANFIDNDTGCSSRNFTFNADASCYIIDCVEITMN